MTTAFTSHTTIDAPVDAVWERLVDWDAAPQWMPGVERLRAQGPVAAGTTLVFAARGKQRTGRIAALDPGRSITLSSVQGGVTANYVYTCEQASSGEGRVHSGGQGTRVTLVADAQMTGWLRMLAPVIRLAIRRADRGQLDAFAATFASA